MNKIKVKFYDIVWEENNNDLPDELVVNVDGNIDLDQYGADVISDKTGFLVVEFLYKRL